MGLLRALSKKRLYYKFILLKKMIKLLDDFVPFKYKAIMKCFKGLLFVLSISIAAISIVGCSDDPAKVALETEDPSLIYTAVKQVKDPSILSKIALEAVSPIARRQAVQKVYDQPVLAKIAIDDDSERVRSSAIYNLTDQSLLAKVAVESKYLPARLTAFYKLTDQSLLKTVTLKLSTIGGDMFDTYSNFLILAFGNVPTNRHLAIFKAILPALKVLSDAEILKIVGEIVSIKIGWYQISRGYTGSLTGEMQGEMINCIIKLKNLSKPLSHSYGTIFPRITTKLNFQGAYIRVGHLLGPVFKRLPQKLLAKIIIMESLSDESIRTNALSELTDQSVLVKIAMEDKSSIIRSSAVKKLTDQSVLVKIAMENKSWAARSSAVKKLTDQSVLVKIAMEDKSWKIRSSAVKKLTDQSVLVKIAMEDKSSGVRSSAVKKLTDQSILAQIALEGDFSSRQAAVEKLNDRSLLVKIYVEDKGHGVSRAAKKRLKLLGLNIYDLKDINKYLITHPKSYFVILIRGYLYTKINEPEKAEKDFKTFINEFKGDKIHIKKAKKMLIELEAMKGPVKIKNK